MAWTNRGFFQIASCFHPGKSTEVGTTPPKPSTGPSGIHLRIFLKILPNRRNRKVKSGLVEFDSDPGSGAGSSGRESEY